MSWGQNGEELSGVLGLMCPTWQGALTHILTILPAPPNTAWSPLHKFFPFQD